jgi:hypothetical protein
MDFDSDATIEDEPEPTRVTEARVDDESDESEVDVDDAEDSDEEEPELDGIDNNADDIDDNDVDTEDEAEVNVIQLDDEDDDNDDDNDDDGDGGVVLGGDDDGDKRDKRRRVGAVKAKHQLTGEILEKPKRHEMVLIKEKYLNDVRQVPSCVENLPPEFLHWEFRTSASSSPL